MSEKLGLALSGGGYRATVFHLGVLKCLQHNGLLDSVGAIAGVSGGAITAAHLHRYWPDYKANFDHAAGAVLEFVQKDTRGRIGRRIPYSIATRQHLTKLLAKEYESLYSNEPKADNSRPQLFLLATELSQASSALAVLSDRLSLLREGKIQDVGRLSMELPMQVAISSSFPGLFPPIRLRTEDLVDQVQGAHGDSLTFTDGGVYDNLGARFFALSSDGDANETVATGVGTVLISDASRASKIESTFRRPSSWLMRSYEISSIRLSEVEVQLLKIGPSRGKDSKPKFVHVPLTPRDGDECSLPFEGDDGLAHPLQYAATRIRTDLDCFSELEIAALLHQGYQSCELQIRDSIKPTGKKAGKEDVEAKDANETPVKSLVPANVRPVYEGEREKRLRGDELKSQKNQLKRGEKRKLRLFSFVDLASYVAAFVVLACVSCVWIGYVKHQATYAIDSAWRDLVESETPKVIVGVGTAVSKSGQFFRQPRTEMHEYKGLEPFVFEEIVKELEVEMLAGGRTGSLQYVPREVQWSNLLAQPMDRECHFVIAQISFAPDRVEENELVFSAPYYFPVRQALVQKASSEGSCLLASSEKITVACTSETTSMRVLEKLKQMGMQIQIYETESIVASRQALKTNTCDAILVDETYVGDIVMLNEEKSDNDVNSEGNVHTLVAFDIDPLLERKEVPFFLRNQQYVVGVSRREPTILSAVNRAIIQMNRPDENGKSAINGRIELEKIAPADLESMDGTSQKVAESES